MMPPGSAQLSVLRVQAMGANKATIKLRPIKVRFIFTSTRAWFSQPEFRLVESIIAASVGIRQTNSAGHVLVVVFATRPVVSTSARRGAPHAIGRKARV